jgi:hypothetical protein
MAGDERARAGLPGRNLAVTLHADAEPAIGDPGTLAGPVAAYCANCRYGVSVAHPGECPMCRSSDWVVLDEPASAYA